MIFGRSLWVHHMNTGSHHSDPHRVRSARRSAVAGAASRSRQNHAVWRACGYGLYVCTYTSPAGPLLVWSAGSTFQFEQNRPWIASPAIHYHLGVDGLSMWLMVLTGFLAPLGVLISWRAIDSRKKLFYVLFLLQQVAMMGIFALPRHVSLLRVLGDVAGADDAADRDIREDRKAASRGVQVFSVRVHSVRIAVGRDVVDLCADGYLDLPTLAALGAQHAISGNPTALWIASLGFLLAFAVKVPIFPLHGWLSDAIFEAPTAAGHGAGGQDCAVLHIAFFLFDFPCESHRIAPLLIVLGAIGIVYGASLALVQNDLKHLRPTPRLAISALLCWGSSPSPSQDWAAESTRS